MFITFEGTEGSGKTSQISLLEKFLHQQGYLVLSTREPGGTPIGDQIRGILADLKNTAMRPRTEILLFQASRAQHVDEVILPCLNRGYVVLCDRFADSTLAYQGYGYQHDLNQLKKIIEFATNGLRPDLTILLDLDVEIGLKRRAQDGEWNRLDAMRVDFHRRVCEGYHNLVKLEPERWVIIDANQDTEIVHSSVRQIVLERLQMHTSS